MQIAITLQCLFIQEQFGHFGYKYLNRKINFASGSAPVCVSGITVVWECPLYSQFNHTT